MIEVLARYDKALRDREDGSCLLAFSAPPPNPAMMDSLTFLTAFTETLGELKVLGCEKLWLHLTAFGGELRIPETLKTLFDDLGMEVYVVSPLRLGPSAALLAFVVYSKLYVNSFTVVDPLQITMTVQTVAVPLQEFIEAMDFLIEEKKPELGALASSGALFAYVRAQKDYRYLEYLINAYVLPKLKATKEDFYDYFVGSSEKVAIGATGIKLKEMMENVVVMDEEDKELSTLSMEAERELRRLKGSANGIIATPFEVKLL